MGIITDSTPLVSMTLGEFWEQFELRFGKHQHVSQEEEVHHPTGRLVYGLKGIEDLFNCSHKTAQFYKDHVINEAVSQNGRKIIVDADLALKLFDERRKKR